VYTRASNAAKKVDEEINSYNKKITKQNDILKNSKTIWKSDDGNSFRKKYNEALNKSKSIVKKYNSIESSLNRLSSKIRKAIDERERAAKKASVLNSNGMRAL